MSKTLDLAQDLIRRPSVTPVDQGCQGLMIRRLEAIGFRVERMRFGEVENFWARRGSAGPVLAFAGHTDVVPPGPLERWELPPFEAAVRDGILYGRGAADMKGSLAAMVTACEAFVAEHPEPQGSIAFLITADEEGPATDGTLKVVQALEARGEKMDWCLVGEPSSTDRLGDVIKNGRRGSLNGWLTVFGLQGHVAYPHLAKNPLHALAPALQRLCAEEWDRGNAFFPPTSFQIPNLNMGTGAENVVPGELEMQFNLRFSTELTPERIQGRIRAILDQHGLDYEIRWKVSGRPFLTAGGALVEAACEAVEKVQGYRPRLDTGGGTSDGRFIAPTGAEVLELGPRNATIHKANECVAVDELDALAAVYRQLLRQLLG